MQILNEFKKINNLVVALGYFDGIHLGHSEVIRQLKKKSKEYNSKTAIITFKSNPSSLFSNQVIYNIQTKKQKEQILNNLEIDYLFELDFTKFKDIEATDYIENYLVANLSPKAIIVGYNHTFGKSKKGTPSLLKELSKKFNYDCMIVDEFKYNDEIVSSTTIRNLISKGEIKKANILLGHDFTIENKVINGNKIARTFKFPTANILWEKDLIKPPYGVYFGKVLVKNIQYNALISWGTRPTITDELDEVLEVHIDNFNKDIYGQIIKVSILEFNRQMFKYSNINELKNQLNIDYINFKNWVETNYYPIK